jgi:hypothetical protein
MKANPKGLNTSRRRFQRAMNTRRVSRIVEREIRFLANTEFKSEDDAILMFFRPRWWLRALGLGRWAERRARERALRILARSKEGCSFQRLVSRRALISWPDTRTGERT